MSVVDAAYRSKLKAKATPNVEAACRCGQPANGKATAKDASKFYLSPEWIALRDRVRREAGGRCQAPGCGRIEHGCISITVLIEGRWRTVGSSERLGVVHSCHTHKTWTERAGQIAEWHGGRSV
jgi:hypothetical protein